MGLRSAGTPEARARLAVRELERTRAFDRKVLVVITVTGSGWVDPDAAVAIEQMYGGDTALVAQQYSYLPSWIAALMDPTASVEASSALFEAVHERWEQEPEATRPQLVVFGQSLGSYGAEAAFAGPDAPAPTGKLARLRGAVRVIVSEPGEYRREQARQLGADRVVDPASEDLRAVVLAESGGRGADVVIVAAPSKVAQQQALDIAGLGGRINFFGGLSKADSVIQFDSNKVHYNELVVTGTTACSTYDCSPAAEI